MSAPLTVAIVGSGNVGTELMRRLRRDDDVQGGQEAMIIEIASWLVGEHQPATLSNAQAAAR
jgi:acetaldehyde dehydrogenase (acetylating)